MNTTTRFPVVRLVLTLFLSATWFNTSAGDETPASSQATTTEFQTAKMELEATDHEFRMVVMDVFRITGRGTVITGKIETGTVVTGQSLCLSRQSGSELEIKVEGIEKFRKILERASAGDNVGLLIGDIPKNEVSAQDVVLGEC